ncbi:ribosome-associated translation inhibitor RaiA [bacterium]|nr:ribosome-associated translation inhibitor RaiA [bacterium]
MKFIITGRHMEVSRGINLYIRKRFKKWSTFLKNNAEVHVVLMEEGYRQGVEVVAKAGLYSVSGRQTTKDMRQSIDLLAEKIDRQLARKHEKLVDSKMPGSRARPPRDKAGMKILEPKTGGRVVEVVSQEGKPMTQEEVMLQLQAGSGTFLIYEDAETGQTAVMIKRQDGNFKLIVKG